MNLSECSTIGGPARSHFFRPEDLAGDRKLLPAFKADGTPARHQWPGEFEWRKLFVHRANIIEQGTPRLPSGWQERAEFIRESIIAEMCDKNNCVTNP